MLFHAVFTQPRLSALFFNSIDALSWHAWPKRFLSLCFLKNKIRSVALLAMLLGFLLASMMPGATPYAFAADSNTIYEATSDVAEAALTGRLQYAGEAYHIQVGDRLGVMIYNQADLSAKDILVRSDGYASFNGVGELLVAGKTVAEVTELLSYHTSKLVKHPYISVSVTGNAAPVVYIAGAVMQPGSVKLNRGVSQGGQNATSGQMSYRVSNAIAAAGGVQLNADLQNVLVMHQNKPYKALNLLNMVQSADSSDDVILQSGDSVFVPALPKMALDDKSYQLLLSSSIGPQTFPVRIIGEVKTAGVYQLDSQSPFINSCIAKSGGYKYGAKENIVAVRRFTEAEKFTTLFVDPAKNDFMLRPNDVVYVPSKKTYKAGRFSANVNQILSPFSSITSSILGFAFLRGN